MCDIGNQTQTDKRPPAKIVALNQWIRDYCARNGDLYLDYYSAMVTEKQLLKPELTGDGLHPNEAGFAVMAPLAENVIAVALGQPAVTATK